MRALLILSFATLILPAQAPPLQFPQASPKASVSQRVGLSDLTVDYARPAVNGRKVWGGLVPYGQVWRAGANENTVLTVSTPVTVGGTSLPAGRYGVHMLPTAAAWTVVFSREAGGWGSYGYDPKEDAARVEVTPVAAEATNRLAYTFDDPTESSVVLSLRWENLRVPVRIEVDTKAVVAANLREQLRGLPQFFPEPWAQAAAWCLRNGTNLDEALAWTDRSLAIRPTFAALRTKADLVAKKGDAAQAEALRTKALALATEAEVNQLGYTLLGAGKVDEALAMFRKNVADHPGSWNVYDSLAEGLAVKGDKAQAIELYQKAKGMVAAADQKARIDSELARLR
jgi:hypothetical protein